MPKPNPSSIAVSQPILGFKVRCLSIDDRLARLNKHIPFVRMDARCPGLRCCWKALVFSDDCQLTFRSGDPTDLQVVVRNAAFEGFCGKTKPLLTLLECSFGVLPIADVVQCADAPRGDPARRKTRAHVLKPNAASHRRPCVCETPRRSFRHFLPRRRADTCP